MLARWRPFADSGAQFDLQSETSKLTIDVIGRTLTGQDLLPHADKAARAMLMTFDYFNHAFNHIFTAPLFVPTARNRALKRAVRMIHELVKDIVEHRRNHPTEPGADLLAMLVESYGSDPDVADLRDNVAIFLGAGTETTAVALCWAWYLLGRDPDAYQKLKEEVDTVLGSNRPTLNDLPRLAYTRMVVDEVMRIYPPAWVISRTAIHSDQLCGFSISGGSTILMSPWITHRSSLYWEDPGKFDPERFTPERSRSRPEYAYYPFGGGPRMCIGDRFSINEQMLTLAMTAQRFRVNISHEGTTDPVFSLRPRGGMRASLESVKSA
jgi:cytochrome P450